MICSRSPIHRYCFLVSWHRREVSMESHVKCLNGSYECAARKHGYCSPMCYMCDPSGVDLRFIKINMQICLPLFGLHTLSPLFLHARGKPSDVVPLQAHHAPQTSPNKPHYTTTTTTMRAACSSQVSRGLWASTAPKPCSPPSPPLSHGRC